MTSMRETNIQAVRGWIQLVTGQPDERVLKVYDHDPEASRTEPPFITIEIPRHRNPIGRDEIVRRLESGVAQFQIRGWRWDLVQVDAFGATAYEWLEDVRFSLRRPPVKRYLDDENVSVERQGPLEDTTATVSGVYERRGTQDFRMNYQIASAWTDAQTGRAKGLQLRGDSVLKEYETQAIADALDLTMTVTK